VSDGRAIEIRSLSGLALPDPEGGPRMRLAVERATLRIYEEALEILLRRTGLQIRLHGGEAQLRLEWNGIPIEAHVKGYSTPDGYLRLELASIRAASWIPIPTGFAGHFIEEKLRGKPGIVRAEDTWADFDLAGALRHGSSGLETLPPLKAVRQEGDWVDLEYAPTQEEGL
jgi:hypothetical protein